MSDGNRIKKISEPPCTRYYPRYEYIWPKLITGPSWKQSRGRTFKKKKLIIKNFFMKILHFLLLQNV